MYPPDAFSLHHRSLTDPDTETADHHRPRGYWENIGPAEFSTHRAADMKCSSTPCAIAPKIIVSMKHAHRFATRAIHAGNEPDPSTGAIMPPVYLSSTYVQEEPAKLKGYDYSRTCNPTRTALERNLAALENGAHGLCFSSGMASINTVLNLLDAGDHVLAGNDLYGGTYRLCNTLYAKYGIGFTFTDLA